MGAIYIPYGFGLASVPIVPEVKKELVRFLKCGRSDSTSSGILAAWPNSTSSMSEGRIITASGKVEKVRVSIDHYSGRRKLEEGDV